MIINREKENRTPPSCRNNRQQFTISYQISFLAAAAVVVILSRLLLHLIKCSVEFVSEYFLSSILIIYQQKCHFNINRRVVVAQCFVFRHFRLVSLHIANSIIILGIRYANVIISMLESRHDIFISIKNYIPREITESRRQLRAQQTTEINETDTYTQRETLSAQRQRVKETPRIQILMNAINWALNTAKNH